MTLQQRAADAAAPVGWFAWFVSHIEQINGVFQFILLVTSIIATVVAIRYHWKRTPK